MVVVVVEEPLEADEDEVEERSIGHDSLFREKHFEDNLIPFGVGLFHESAVSGGGKIEQTFQGPFYDLEEHFILFLMFFHFWLIFELKVIIAIVYEMFEYAPMSIADNIPNGILINLLILKLDDLDFLIEVDD